MNIQVSQSYRTDVRPISDIDHSGRYGFLAYLADCFTPTVWFIRADSWEDAYEIALETIAKDVDPADLSDQDRAQWECGENLPGTSWADGRGLVWSEDVMVQAWI